MSDVLFDDCPIPLGADDKADGAWLEARLTEFMLAPIVRSEITNSDGSFLLYRGPICVGRVYLDSSSWAYESDAGVQSGFSDELAAMRCADEEAGHTHGATCQAASQKKLHR